jgi:ABC-type glycerol-3-phosphate transport system permease component
VKALRDIDKRFQLSEDQHPGSKTLPVAITELSGRCVTNINGIMAGGILAAVPPVLFALIFQNNSPG